MEFKTIKAATDYCKLFGVNCLVRNPDKIALAQGLRRAFEAGQQRPLNKSKCNICACTQPDPTYIGAEEHFCCTCGKSIPAN